MIIENVNVATPRNLEFVTGSGLNSLEILRQVDISIKNGKIESIVPSTSGRDDGRWVIPAFTDPHTHAVFCGSRENELDLRKNLGYEGVLKAGGGIYSTIEATTNCDEYSLYLQSEKRLRTMMTNGTAAFELKTGYGLDIATEEKTLKVMERLQRDLNVPVKKTLLAHVPPKGTEESSFLKDYMRMIDELRKRIDYVDVFVDVGAFSPSFAVEAIKFANSLGLTGRIHLNELENLGGIKALSDLRMSSFDHMLGTSENELKYVVSPVTILPFTAIVLGRSFSIVPKMKEKGKILCLGSDLSPNTYVTSMPFILSLARQLTPLTIANLVNMSTLNSSFSLSLSGEMGSLHPGKRANLIVLKDNFSKIGYEFGNGLVEEVFIDGKEVRNHIKAQENQGM